MRSSSCLGALLFLPLVDFHLSECLEALCSSAAAAAAAGSDSAALTNGARRLEAAFTGFSVEDVGLAALRLLHLLVSHSDEVMSHKHHFKLKHARLQKVDLL